MSTAAKKLRACMVCSFLATASEFKQQCVFSLAGLNLAPLTPCRPRRGCPNCEDILSVSPAPFRRLLARIDGILHSPFQMKGQSDRVLECTTLKFDGAIAVIAPELSWVVRPHSLSVSFPFADFDF